MKQRISRREASRVLERGVREVGEDDLERVVSRADEIERRFSSGGPLGRFIRDFRILMSLLRDYMKGSYRKIPWWTVAAVTTALMYVLNPVDIVPDFIPGVGLVDDAMVLGVCLKAIEQDLERYRKWKSPGPD